MRSKKNKGKRLEAWIREQILTVFGLPNESVRITIGVETGSDIKMTTEAAQAFPFRVEAKNQEGFSTVYRAYEQATNATNPHKFDTQPLVVIKSNHKQPLAILDAVEFFKIYRKAKNGSR